MRYDSDRPELSYFPPLLGNGDVSFSPDREGTLGYTWEKAQERLTNVPSNHIFRAGRRLAIEAEAKAPAKILSFGTFSFDYGEQPTHFTQELIEARGEVRSRCGYPDGGSVDSVCFLHGEKNLFGLRKRFSCPEKEISFTYRLEGYDLPSDEAILRWETAPMENGAEMAFCLLGQKRYTGGVRVFLDRPCRVVCTGREITLSTPIRDGDEVTFWLCLADDLFDDYETLLTDMAQTAAEKGFSALLEESAAQWEKYFSIGSVETGDRRLDEIYRAALYASRCYTTRWSIPIGINNCYWDGKFFAFDEYYSFLGLLEAGRTELAGRVPAFRRDVCLKKAIRRLSYTKDGEEARFPWETNEYGEEVAMPGIWHDHVFHMPLIGIGAWEYYEFTGDMDYLEKTYPMLRACAKFFTVYMLYELNGSLVVGRCTDLERLGGAVLNPFMTSCGVIKLLEVTAQAAELLGIDGDFREECLRDAAGLRKSLPQTEEMYVPYLGCEQKSVAVFAGKYPFNVLAGDDPKLLRAWEDFIANEAQYGNMYPMGKKVSPWYAAWKAEGYARCGNGEKAMAYLREAMESSGVFGELFEINEPDLLLKPWFSTAEGIFLSTVSEMLLQSDGENIDVLPAFPAGEGTIRFTLSIRGGAVASYTIEKGEITRERIVMRPGVPVKTFTVRFRGRSHPVTASRSEADAGSRPEGIDTERKNSSERKMGHV